MNIKLLKLVIKNPNILYILNKYGIFVISFFNSLFIAVKLGAFSLGIWGFINLIIGYMVYASLGIPNSLNVIVSKNKENTHYVKDIYHNSLGLLSIIIFVLLAIYCLLNYSNIQIGEKYQFSKYSTIAIIIIISNLVNGNLSILLRIYNKVNLISLTQSFYPILTLLSLFLFDKSNLLDVLIYILLVSNILTTLLYLIFSPFKFGLKYNLNLMKYIQTKGIYLFVYNASFYFIMLSTKSFVSDNYSVEDFGLFTFSFSFANSALLLLTTLSFLIFPKMIAVLSSKNNVAVIHSLDRIRSVYIVFSHLLIHFAIFIYPFFLYFFPQYLGTLTSFQLIGLTLIMYNNSFGYQTLLMARDKEKLLALLSFGALILNILLNYILSNIYKVQFSYLILSTLIAYFIYVIALTFFGRKSLQLGVSFRDVNNDVNSSKILIPYLVSFICIVAKVHVIFFLVPLILIIFLNRNTLKDIVKSGVNLLKNPNTLNI